MVELARHRFSFRPPVHVAIASGLLLAAGCGDSEADLTDASTSGAADGSSGAVDDDGGDDATGGTDSPAPAVAGSCTYVSPFTQGTECREYTGAEWTDDELNAACNALSGSLAVGASCDPGGTLGECVLDDGPERQTRIFVYGDDASSCADQQTGCEIFGGGTWEPSAVCDDGGEPGGGGGGNVFIQPTLECRDPLPGEAPGTGPNGQVCTWQAISGCTEEGRRFDDYASCDVVRTQRPYYPKDPAPARGADPRLDDPTYVTELDWVRSQIASSGCVCCHSTEIAPATGPSNWSIDAPGNFMDTFFDSGLALGAGWVDSTAFGAYPPEDNHGFERETSGFPSTEPARMRDFFIAELAYRGLSEGDFADAPPFGGPLYDQLVYEPSACDDGQGIDPDGTIRWTGGGARYIYVMEATAQSPTVPPNLDLPDGTLWRVDVPASGTPLATGEVTYGEVPGGMTQRFPEQGGPAALQPGTAYYLYVTKDVGIPITRCLATL